MQIPSQRFAPRPLAVLKNTLAGLVVLLSVTVATSAFADVIDPAEAACQGVTEGGACKSPETGTCEKAQCCKLDYSNKTDAGAPTSVCSDCLKCKDGAAADASAETDTGGVATADTGGVAPADTAGSAPTTTSKKSGGCSASGYTVRGHTLPWTTLGSLLLGLVGVLALRRRRA